MICEWCGEEMQMGDMAAVAKRGVMHLECFVCSVVGTVAHQENRRPTDDESRATRRESARAAHVYFKRGIAH